MTYDAAGAPEETHSLRQKGRLNIRTLIVTKNKLAV